MARARDLRSSLREEHGRDGGWVVPWIAFLVPMDFQGLRGIGFTVNNTLLYQMCNSNTLSNAVANALYYGTQYTLPLRCLMWGKET